jgi:hypothetical protein
MRLIINSGAEVPNDTTVRPMAMVEMPHFFAIDEAPLTIRSAPFIKMRNPARSSAIGQNMVRRVV